MSKGLGVCIRDMSSNRKEWRARVFIDLCVPERMLLFEHLIYSRITVPQGKSLTQVTSECEPAD
jgi:hypothetical protein